MQVMYKKFQIYLKAHVSGREMATKKIYSYRMNVLVGCHTFLRLASKVEETSLVSGEKWVLESGHAFTLY
uniref:MATH domain-containing protein n=1 Tax=Strongyloides venezuelensis TaxID=75913 RepID=A0A0K0G623_STRVS